MNSSFWIYMQPKRHTERAGQGRPQTRLPLPTPEHYMAGAAGQARSNISQVCIMVMAFGLDMHDASSYLN
jgi:hypothetical protein